MIRSKIVVAPNALKGTLSAFKAARAIADGIKAVFPDAIVVELPIADGGDGTREILCRARGGVTYARTVEDALGRPIQGSFSLVDGELGLVDVATASGLARLAPHELDPIRASSFGTGQLIRAAFSSGARRVLLGVGGSACVDGGAGILEALGARLLDHLGNPIPRGGGGLHRLARLELDAVPARVRGAIRVACDVENPLLGPEGAARVFGPQKGATVEQVETLEQGLAHFATVLEASTSRSVCSLARGGAAGGIAAGLAGALDAELVSGIDLVLDEVGFERVLAGASLVLTAEGRLDGQSAANKGPFGVARRALRAGVPTLVLAGQVAPDISTEALKCFAGAYFIAHGSVSVERAMANAGPELRKLAERVAREALAGRFR